MDELIQRALKAKRESKYIDFKETLNLSQPHDWCEIIKDVVAMANAGGGVILIGVDNSGKPTGIDPTPILDVDPAVITDKMYKYTGIHFSDFDISEHLKRGHKVVAFRIHAVSIPIVFVKPGTYQVDDKKQKTAFSVGTVYFRHGAKSEPGTSDDIRKVIERQLDTIRKSWVKGIRKVVKAPPGTQVVTLPAGTEVIETTSPQETPIRITDDLNAPAYRKLDYDKTHPYRQKEVIEILNERLKGQTVINQYDMLCVKRLYDIAPDERFCHLPKFYSPQYSPAFVDWVEGKFMKDKKFFVKLRRKAPKQ